MHIVKQHRICRLGQGHILCGCALVPNALGPNALVVRAQFTRATRLGLRKHLRALLKGQQTPTGADRVQQERVTQARACPHIQHHVAVAQIKQGDGSLAQWHGELGRGVVARRMPAVFVDGDLVVRGGHCVRHSRLIVRIMQCVPRCSTISFSCSSITYVLPCGFILTVIYPQLEPGLGTDIGGDRV